MAYKTEISNDKIEVIEIGEPFFSTLEPAKLTMENDGSCFIRLKNIDAEMMWTIQGPVSSQQDALVFECSSI